MPDSKVSLKLISLFPEALKAYFEKGIFERGLLNNRFEIEFINLRDFSKKKFKQVDDAPYGGRQGMVIKPDVIYDAITSIDHYQEYRLLYTCPKGPCVNQKMVAQWYDDSKIILLCGYYEGIDERIIKALDIQRVSVGNLVLSSGELPALIIAEAIVRQVKGVIGKEASVANDSIISGLLEHPLYTSPKSFQNQDVPDVLRSGHHKQIAEWKQKESLRETFLKKPQMLSSYPLTPTDKQLLTDILKE